MSRVTAKSEPGADCQHGLRTPCESGFFTAMREYATLVVGYGVLGIGCVAFSLVALPLNFVLRDRQRNWLGRRMAMHGFRAYLFGLERIRAAQFDLCALDPLRDRGPLIIAANHPGLLDAPMIVSRLPNVVCLVKSSLLRSIFWGAGARLSGYISNDWFLGSVSLAVEELEYGSQILLFPEGTRTEMTPLNPFRTGAAYISYRSRVPIQTVIVEQDTNFLGKDYPFFRRPGMPMHFRVRLGVRFDPPDDPRVFTDTLRDYFIAELARNSRALPSER